MKILLNVRQRIWHEAGEIVEVSPAEAQHLLTIGAAVPVSVQRETPAKKKETRKKG